MSDRVEHQLSDGSLVVIEDDGRMAGIERWVNGECVWGQVFSHSFKDVHETEVAEVVAAIRANPPAFNRRVLWDADGRAVAHG